MCRGEGRVRVTGEGFGPAVEGGRERESEGETGCYLDCPQCMRIITVPV
jgi:hypothetical protein